MDRAETIDVLWENSSHGTRREDIEAAYNAGVEASVPEGRSIPKENDYD